MTTEEHEAALEGLLDFIEATRHNDGCYCHVNPPCAYCERLPEELVNLDPEDRKSHALDLIAYHEATLAGDTDAERPEPPRYPAPPPQPERPPEPAWTPPPPTLRQRQIWAVRALFTGMQTATREVPGERGRRPTYSTCAWYDEPVAGIRIQSSHWGRSDGDAESEASSRLTRHCEAILDALATGKGGNALREGAYPITTRDGDDFVTSARGRFFFGPTYRQPAAPHVEQARAELSLARQLAGSYTGVEISGGISPDEHLALIRRPTELAEKAAGPHIDAAIRALCDSLAARYAAAINSVTDPATP